MSLIKSYHSGKSQPSFKLSKVLTFLLIIMAIELSTQNFSYGQGNLLITPRRVVFEGSKRSIDLNLANTGKDTATYAISLVEIKMKEDGGFETITKPDSGQLFADRFIRFFPRAVTLGPGRLRWLKYSL